MPAVECITVNIKPDFPLGEVARRQAKAIAEHVAKAEGLISISWGFHLEEERKNTWFLTWETVDAHIAYTKQPGYKDFIAEIMQYCEPVGYFHVEFDGPFDEILAKAPVVEFFVAHISEDTDREAWLKNLSGLQEVGADTLPKDKVYGFANGWSVEDERRFVLLGGWESKEVHESWKAGLSEEQTKKAFGPLRTGVVKAEMVHVDVANGSRKQ